MPESIGCVAAANLFAPSSLLQAKFPEEFLIGVIVAFEGGLVTEACPISVGLSQKKSGAGRC